MSASEEAVSSKAVSSKVGPGFVRRNAVVLLLAGLCAVLSVVIVIQNQRGADALQAQREELSELDSQLRGLQLRRNDLVDTDVFEVLAISRDRVAEDATVIEDFLSEAFTWDSGRSYDEARQRLIEGSALAEDAQFLTVMMPPSRYNETADGTRYYYIDSAGLAMSVDAGAAQVEVVEVRATTYVYAVIVDVTVSSPVVVTEGPAFDATAERRMLVYLTLDGDNQVVDASGVAPGGQTRS